MNININDISETALLMVLCHALDAESNDPILNDHSSIEVLKGIREAIGDSNSKMHRIIKNGNMEKGAVKYISIRAKYYDDRVREYIATHPNATIINIGCGLDMRFQRIDNGKIRFYDLDFPDIINIKKQLTTTSDRYQFIAQSVFDSKWMDAIPNENVLFLAEGVFMYCNGNDVKQLFLTIQDRYPGSELICEMYNKFWLNPILSKMNEISQKIKFGMGPDANFKFGIYKASDIEKWHPSIKCIDQWSVLESGAPQMGLFQYLKNSKALRKVIWTIRYAFHQN